MMIGEDSIDLLLLVLHFLIHVKLALNCIFDVGEGAIGGAGDGGSVRIHHTPFACRIWLILFWDD